MHVVLTLDDDERCDCYDGRSEVRSMFVLKGPEILTYLADCST